MPDETTNSPRAAVTPMCFEQYQAKLKGAAQKTFDDPWDS